MDLSFTEEQQILKKFASDFLTDNLPKKKIREIEESESGYLPEMWKMMAELGWMGLPFPEQYGGTNMTMMDLTVLLEEMGRASLPSPYLATVVMGAFPIFDFGSEAQKTKYLSEVAKGNMILTLAVTESDTALDPAFILTKASKSGNDWVLNGTKLFVPFAHIADYILCVAKTDDKNMTVFIVDRKSPGITCTVMESMAGKPCEVVFKDVKVPGANVLGEVNKGWDYFKKMLLKIELGICSEMGGLAQQVMDMTVQYSKDRKQFGKPIGVLQIIQHYASDMFTEMDGMKLNTYKAAWKMTEGLPCEEEVATAKAWAAQASEKVTGPSHQIHGAIGSTLEYDLHYYTRRLKAHTLTFGDARYYREIIAQKMGL